MIKYLVLLAFAFLFNSCLEREKKSTVTERINSSEKFYDSLWVKDYSYAKGDVRRYGLYPDESIQESTLNTVLNLAEEGLILTFPKGFYKTNFELIGKKNITIYFDDVTIGGAINIINVDSETSVNIKLKGKICVLDKVFLQQAKNISFEDLIIKSDTTRNIHNRLNRGLSIYAGSKNIFFEDLKILDTGGTGDDFYKFTAAALQIHGWNDNPENIVIRNLLIQNASRTAVYITGNNHKIGKAKVENYGKSGSSNNMFGLEDAKSGSEKLFTGFWINKCNDCIIDSLEISNLYKTDYSLKLGIGEYSKPAVINNIRRSGKSKHEPIEDDILTNVLVKNEY